MRASVPADAVCSRSVEIPNHRSIGPAVTSTSCIRPYGTTTRRRTMMPCVTSRSAPRSAYPHDSKLRPIMMNPGAAKSATPAAPIAPAAIEPAMAHPTTTAAATTTAMTPSSTRRMVRNFGETATQRSTGDANAWSVAVIRLPRHAAAVLEKQSSADKRERRSDTEPTGPAVAVDTGLAEIREGIDEKPPVDARDDRRGVAARLREHRHLGDEDRLQRPASRVAHPRPQREGVQHLECGQHEQGHRRHYRKRWHRAVVPADD